MPEDILFSEKEFERLERAPSTKEPVLDEEDWKEFEHYQADAAKRRRRAYWEFKRKMDFQWREGQDGYILDYLKNVYEEETKTWFQTWLKKGIKKKYRRILKSAYLVRHDSYCYHVDVIGVLKDGRKVRLITRRVIL